MAAARGSNWRRLALGIAAATVVWLLLLWAFLPYDNPFVLFLRFTGQKISSFLGLPGANDNENWLFATPRFDTDLRRDVAFIVKTGYGTQARVPAQLDALSVTDGADLKHSLVVIADFATVISYQGWRLPIHDVVGTAMTSDALAEFRDSDRLLKYQNMTAAIHAGDQEGAAAIGQAVGWELDAMKFLPGLELAYRMFPGKKWYVMLDDDTYLFQPSLRALLGHLNPAVASYVGNAVGDYKGRFAHGGSSFLVSRPAMEEVFDQKSSEVVRSGYVESLTETWGDKLVATTFMQMGVYLDERYGRLFNGERPKATKVQRDRFCSAVVSFHGLAQPQLMKEVGDKFRDISQPVLWGDLWDMYDQPAIDTLAQQPVRQGQDHVGVRDVSMLAEGVQSAEGCLNDCVAREEDCLAWTWDEEQRVCRYSPWVVIGEYATDALYSGLNVAEVSHLRDACRHGP